MPILHRRPAAARTPPRPAPVVIEKEAGDDAWARVEALARRYEPAIAEAILKALESVRDRIALEALAEALAAGDLAAASAALGIDLDAFRGVSQILGAAARVGAATLATAPGLRPELRLLIGQPAQNPLLRQWLDSYTLPLIRQIAEDTRAGIHAALTAGFQAGVNPLDTARAVRGHLTAPAAAEHAKLVKSLAGLTEHQTRAVLNFRRMLTELDATALTRALRDKRHDKTLLRAIKDAKPLSPERIEAMVARYAQRFLKYRAEVIARTESLRAANMGVVGTWAQAAASGAVAAALVRKEWIVGPPERLCAVCRVVPERNRGEGWGIGLEQAFDTPNGPVQVPPLHPQCRCIVFCRTIEPRMIGRPAAAAF